MSDLCYDCDEDDAVREWDLGEDHGFWTGLRFIQVCEACWRKRDNYEPPEPDGECFRGNEAEAHRSELMARAQRLR